MGGYEVEDEREEMCRIVALWKEGEGKERRLIRTG